MIYTSYKEEELKMLPKKYHNKVLGVKSDDYILQPPLCPICGAEMMTEGNEFLSCTECGELRNLRVLK